MDDNKLRFGVGVLVIAAIGVGIILTFLFGAFPRVFTGEYTLLVAFPSADGIAPNTPVLFRGVQVGRVSDIKLQNEDVLLTLRMETNHQQRITHEYIPRIGTGSVITGDAKLEFVRADEADLARIHEASLDRVRKLPYSNEQMLNFGKTSTDPFALLFDLEEELVDTLDSIKMAGNTISGAGENVNLLIADARQVVGGANDQLDGVADEAKIALEEFQGAMRSVKTFLSDDELRTGLNEALDAVPVVLGEAQMTLQRFNRVGENFEEVGKTANATLKRVDGTVEVIREAAVAGKDALENAQETFASARRTIENIERISDPLAENADAIVGELLLNLENLNATLIEAKRFGAALNNSDGTIRRLLTDDEIYWQVRRIVENIENASARIRPILDDVRIFSDKIARDPRELGVRGALDKRPSRMGVK